MAIAGHSRNGKQSLIAAAFDDRITAVVGSSPGAPISAPWAFSSHNFYGEGPDADAHSGGGRWWLRSTRQYSAAPQALPMDGHGVLALIAPRHAAVAGAWTDHEGDDVFADEMGVRAAARVYALLGAPERLRMIHRPGDHHGFNDVHTYFDWFDAAFGRAPGPMFALAWGGQQQVGLLNAATRRVLVDLRPRRASTAAGGWGRDDFMQNWCVGGGGECSLHFDTGASPGGWSVQPPAPNSAPPSLLRDCAKLFFGANFQF